jgi:hypothetical protein
MEFDRTHTFYLTTIVLILYIGMTYKGTVRKKEGGASMHRTLFTPSMVETFRACKRAYEMAFSRYANGSANATAAAICRRFILKGIAEINRSRLTNVHQVQKFMGQNWPVDKLAEQFGDKESNTKAFLFAYKTLTRYINQQYRPEGAEVAAVALKLRARVAHVRVYVEDTIDLVLWYPEQQVLEFVDFQTQPLKQLDAAWPSADMLFKQHLAERLKIRWPFEKLLMTSCRVSAQEISSATVSLDDSSTYRVHWQDMLKTLDEMKQPPDKEARQCACGAPENCKYCSALVPVLQVSEGKLELFFKTA